MAKYKRIKGFEDYEISSIGRVYSYKSGIRKRMKPRRQVRGYLFVDLYRNGSCKSFKVHRLVGIYFISNPRSKPEINHKNGNKRDNRASQLEWATSSENKKHAFKTGLSKISDKNKASLKLSIQKSCSIPVSQFSKSGKLVNKFPSQKEAERKTGVRQSNITSCIHNKAKSAGGYIWKLTA